MKTKKLDGFLLEKMLRNGLANLKAHEQELNDLNVFPVPDGDTGTNMLLTLGNGINNTQSFYECGRYLVELSNAMLLAARGNSGVILSQIFTGFAMEVGRCPYLGPGELRNALIRGYRNAYAVTIQPVEGTILTVCREGIEHIRTMITRNSSMEDILSMYLGEMRKSLTFTPEILNVLKDAGVVDSGALGYIYIFEGMLKYLFNDVLPDDYVEATASFMTEDKADIATGGKADFSLFNEYSIFEDGYCMEFILQLMKNIKYNQHFNLKAYIEDLKLYGNSLVVVQNGQRVKVHIHTQKPAKVINLSQEFGEFLTFKLENMQIQHNERTERIEKNITRNDVAIVAVSYGDGMTKLFKQLGANFVIECNQKSGVASEEFLRYYDRCNADTVIVFPNDNNLIPAAEQAVKLFADTNSRIVVMPTKTVAEGYFALAMDLRDEKDVERRIELMKNGMANVATIYEVTAVKDYVGEFVSCNAGEETAIINKTPVCKGANKCDTLIEGLSKVEDIEDYEVAIIFKGEDVTDDEQEMIESMLEEQYPLLDVTFVEGNQKAYNLIVGLS